MGQERVCERVVGKMDKGPTLTRLDWCEGPAFKCLVALPDNAREALGRRKKGTGRTGMARRLRSAHFSDRYYV